MMPWGGQLTLCVLTFPDQSGMFGKDNSGALPVLRKCCCSSVAACHNLMQGNQILCGQSMPHYADGLPSSKLGRQQISLTLLSSANGSSHALITSNIAHGLQHA